MSNVTIRKNTNNAKVTSRSNIGVAATCRDNSTISDNVCSAKSIITGSFCGGVIGEFKSTCQVTNNTADGSTIAINYLHKGVGALIGRLNTDNTILENKVADNSPLIGEIIGIDNTIDISRDNIGYIRFPEVIIKYDKRSTN